MSKQIMVLAAVGAVAFIVYQKQKAGTLNLTGRPLAQSAPIPSRNVNGDMWSAILGAGAWRNLLGGATNNGTQAFTVTDGYGRVTTSDGVPIGSGDYLDDWVSANTGLPATYADNVANPYLLDDLGLSGNNGAGAAAFSDYKEYTGTGTVSYNPTWGK